GSIEVADDAIEEAEDLERVRGAGRRERPRAAARDREGGEEAAERPRRHRTLRELADAAPPPHHPRETVAGPLERDVRAGILEGRPERVGGDVLLDPLPESADRDRVQLRVFPEELVQL